MNIGPNLPPHFWAHDITTLDPSAIIGLNPDPYANPTPARLPAMHSWRPKARYRTADPRTLDPDSDFYLPADDSGPTDPESEAYMQLGRAILVQAFKDWRAGEVGYSFNGAHIRDAGSFLFAMSGEYRRNRLYWLQVAGGPTSDPEAMDRALQLRLRGLGDGKR